MFQDNNSSFHLTYKANTRSLIETSATNHNPNCGIIKIKGGSYFGSDFGEAAVYYDGIGFSMDLKLKIESLVVPVTTNP